MNIRSVLIFLASLLDEAIIVAALLLGLPRVGIHIPLPAFIVIMVALVTYAVVTYRLIVRAITKRPLVGLTDMTGTRGKAISMLDPKGTVNIRGELWQATARGERIEKGEEVTVLSREGLRLIVARIDRAEKRDKTSRAASQTGP